MIGNQLIVHDRTVPDLLVLGHAESQAGRRLRRPWSQVSFCWGLGHMIRLNSLAKMNCWC
jgi:hypothetical protein